MADIKSTARKEAIVFFVCMLFVSVCWVLIAKNRISAS